MNFSHYLTHSHPLFSSPKSLILNDTGDSQMLRVMFFQQLQPSKTLKNYRKIYLLIYIALELKKKTLLTLILKISSAPLICSNFSRKN